MAFSAMAFDEIASVAIVVCMDSTQCKEEMLAPAAVARECGVTSTTIHNWYRDGVIKGVCVRRRYRSLLRIPRSEVERLKGGGVVTPTEPPAASAASTSTKTPSLSSRRRRKR